MYLCIFLLQAFIVVANAQTSQIIRDYFVYKNVTRVAGFSCGDVDGKSSFTYNSFTPHIIVFIIRGVKAFC